MYLHKPSSGNYENKSGFYRLLIRFSTFTKTHVFQSFFTYTSKMSSLFRSNEREVLCKTFALDICKNFWKIPESNSIFSEAAG